MLVLPALAVCALPAARDAELRRLARADLPAAAVLPLSLAVARRHR
jgi:hypothetical protein